MKNQGVISLSPHLEVLQTLKENVPEGWVNFLTEILGWVVRQAVLAVIHYIHCSSILID